VQGYGLKRLARGLASSRQGARQGFAAALAATLAHSAAAVTGAAQQQQLAVQRPFVSAAGVLALLNACLEVTGSMKGTVSGCCLVCVLCAVAVSDGHNSGPGLQGELQLLRKISMFARHNCRCADLEQCHLWLIRLCAFSEGWHL
jgi:hypothetical protein